MTRNEALRAAEECLQFVRNMRIGISPEVNSANALMAQAKAEAAKGYISLANSLKIGS